MTSEDAVPKRPGWLVLFTWGAFLCTVPSALWRVAMIMGWLPDTSELRARELGSNAIDGYLYVYALSIVQVSFSFCPAAVCVATAATASSKIGRASCRERV